MSLPSFPLPSADSKPLKTITRNQPQTLAPPPPTNGPPMFFFPIKKSPRRQHLTPAAAASSSWLKSLDLSPSAPSDQTSFRIGGRVEFDLLCRTLGFSGPEDFAIPAAAWEASLKARSPPSLKSEPQISPPDSGDARIESTASPPEVSTLSPPSVLARPPYMKLPALDGSSSAWDLVRSFAPPDESDGGCERREDCTGSFSTSSNDDDSSSAATTESMFLVSPNGRIKRIVGSWMRGQLLGSGSFGTVFEGIGDDGGFFAVKEVSLLEKGSSAQQCIFQLEQEIALLSQFEHENIVQYYGTDKEESKLFIFLELVTQGSLASLYHKYPLRHTQVSAYTRQILNGLQYLHERNVVHRDIKCANILVHANGSVKLADFGLAKEMSKLNDLKSCKGSVYWMAPEVINPKKTYGYAADIWSLGCTVLEMLTRQIPYPHLEWQQAFFKIGRGDQPPIPRHLSKEAQDFIRQCVQVDPNSRPTAAQLLEHPFIRRPINT